MVVVKAVKILCLFWSIKVVFWSTAQDLWSCVCFFSVVRKLCENITS